MPKLYFRYGAMGSGKTVNLLVALHQYSLNGKKAILIKPKVDTRKGRRTVWTRVPGLARDADIILAQSELLTDAQVSECKGADCVFVDEAQFLHPAHVEQLSQISCYVSVICYGLRTNFQGRLFSGSKALMEWADCIEEVKNVCKYCKHKSTHNLKVQLSPEDERGGVQLGADDMYVGVCKQCFYDIRGKQDLAIQQCKVYRYPETEVKDPED